MTVNIDLSLVTSLPFLITIYVIGLIVAANMAVVYARRNTYGFMPQHLFFPILWPIVAAVWVLTIPARSIKD